MHLTLRELLAQIDAALSENLPPSQWVVAEVAELRVAQRGHAYLDLVEKEDQDLVAKSRATIWAYQYRAISSRFEKATGQALRSGLSLLLRVEVRFHALYGFSLNVVDIDASYTLGERARQRQEVLDRLAAEGLIDLNKALELPLVPQRIAIVSSPSAAGYGDFMDQLTTNPFGYLFQTELFSATMQGDEAPESIARALAQIYQRQHEFDVAVIIRGGGAQLDLDAFDSYDLANHIAGFPLPVLTGIGHERDESVADLVAHTKLKTPTAVAEFLVDGLAAFEAQVLVNAKDTFRKAERAYSQWRHQLQRQAHQVQRLAAASQQHHSEQLGQLGTLVKLHSKQSLKDQRSQVNQVAKEVPKLAKANYKTQTDRLTQLAKQLELMHPDTALRRGFSLTTANGQWLSKADLTEGQELETRTRDKHIRSTITHIDEREN